MRATRGYSAAVPLPEPALRQALEAVPPGGAVLDVGCHDGGLLARLRAAGPDRELADVYLDRAAVEADLRVGSIAELPFADAIFDLVMGMDVVEHLPGAPPERRRSVRCDGL
jgi:2-polyprenyl-3-methyl-5-hydroxy-6-metoxy-1,4-benzoquinol methylase